MGNLLQDLKYALRTMARDPGFALVAVLTLTLGIGANGAIFNLANAMLLKPLPGKDPQELVRLQRRNAAGNLSRTSSYAAYRGLGAQRDLGEVSAVALVTVAWTQGNTAHDLLGEVVSANYFAMLGVNALHGRVFSTEQDTAVERTVVLSHSFWQSRLGGAESAVGQSLTLNGEVFTVVGIAPKKFLGTQAGLVANVWVPLEQSLGWVGARGWTEDPTANRLELFARRAYGHNVAQAQAVADSVAQRLVEAHPEISRTQKIVVTPARMLEGQFRNGVTAFLGILLAIVGLVLLTASANVTNLLLVRMAGRRRELAVRMALGASRPRLLQQLLSESLLLAALAGVGGAIVASWASELLVQFNPLPASIPITFDLTMDARVYFFVAALAAGTAVLLGLLPAWQASRPGAIAALKEEAARSTGISGARTRQIFVTAQVALSLAVLVVASLFLRSMQNAARMELGFEPERALALDLDVQAKGWNMERANQYYREVQRRVERLPGVQSVAFMNLAPLDTATRRTPVAIEGQQVGEGREPLQLSFNRVSPDYFVTLRIPLRAGRDFTERDDAARPAVAVINESMARRYWPGEDALGKRFRLLAAGGGPIEAAVAASVVEVIGVAADVKYRTLGETPEPHFYVPYLQSFDSSRALVARTAGESRPLLGVVQRELVSFDATLPGFFGRTLQQHIALAYLPSRMAGIVSGAFGLLALALTAMGMYGVLAHSVMQRTRELGIRMALGATRAQVLQLVLGQAMWLVLIGAAVGAAATLGLAGFVQSFLHGVSPADPLSYLLATGILSLFALLACWVPARRATRVDPVIALRHE